MFVFKYWMMIFVTLLMPWSALADEAIFAGGCFWCMEKPFEQVEGVTAVISGYSGGKSSNPSYKNYGAGGHIEVVKVIFDAEKVSYDQLLDIFWQQIDPTDAGGQFVDRGHEYSTAIFYLNESQRKIALASKMKMDAKGVFGAPVVTPVKPASVFHAAEEYHQNYYAKNPVRYWYYRSRSGRDDYLVRIWGDAAKHDKGP